MAGPPRAVVRRAALLLLVGAGYYLGARFGLRLSLVEHNVTPLWPPTGIALAAFLVFGRSLWPGIAIAAFLVNLPISSTVTAAAVTAAGNVAAPLVAATLLRRLGFDRQLASKRDAYLIVFVGALGSMLISATIGTLTLVVSDSIEPERLLGAWAVWWTGDAMGVLTVAPLLLSLPLFREHARWSPWQWLEAALALSVVGLAVDGGLHADPPVLFPSLVLLGWAAWRLQLRGVAPAALLASALAAWHASHAHGLFSEGTLLARMLTLQGYNASVALTSFFLAALVTERLRTTELLRDATTRLEARVREEVKGRSREHEIAETLQRALLPDRLPAVPGAELAARYVPASADLRVGGDWYDVVRLPGGAVGLAIGDVAGHGLGAAADMAQLRMALRVHAHQSHSPGAVLSGLQQLVAQLPGSPMATLLYLVFDPATRRLTYANAGHPPALLVVDGRATFLREALSPPIGARAEGPYAEVAINVAPGTTLLLYTDGLVERRDASIDDQLAVLSREALAEAAPDELCDLLVARLLQGGPGEDDVAVLVLRLGGDGSPLRLRLPAEPRELLQARIGLRRWLADVGVGGTDTDDVLLACGEACSNVVEHAYAGVPGTLDVDARLLGATIEIVVRDHGVWRAETERDAGGWGLDLARSLMDDVEVRGSADGTEVTMRRTVRFGGAT